MHDASAVIASVLEDRRTCLLRCCEDGRCHSEHAFSIETERVPPVEDALGSGVSQQEPLDQYPELGHATQERHQQREKRATASLRVEGKRMQVEERRERGGGDAGCYTAERVTKG